MPVTPGRPQPTIRPQRSAFGEDLAAQLHPIIQNSFEYGVGNTRLLASAVAGDGTVTGATALAVLTSSATASSSARLQSVRAARYRAGIGGLFRGTASFTTGAASTTQLIGLADEAGSTSPFKNGYMIGFVAGATFGVHRFANDATSSVALAACDDPLDGTGASGMTLDVTKINVYAIRFQYLGAGAIQYLIEGDGSSKQPGEFFVFHTIDFANANTVPSVYMPNFKCTGYVANTTTTNVVLKSASWAYFLEGITIPDEIQSHQPLFGSGTQQATSVTTEVPVFTIRGRATYASVTNFIQVAIVSLTASVEAAAANNLAAVRLVLNATLGATPSWSDISTATSVIEIDTGAGSITGGTTLLTIPLAGKNDKYVDALDGLGILLGPGETLTVMASSANSATIDASLSWRELF